MWKASHFKKVDFFSYIQKNQYELYFILLFDCIDHSWPLEAQNIQTHEK